MVRTQIQITDGRLKALRALSASTGRSISHLVRESVEQYLTSQSVGALDERIERAKRIAGKFASGNGDVSARHDVYLAKALTE